MNAYVIGFGFIFSILSAAIISYISMATMVGPWIAPTLVLISGFLLKFRKKKVEKGYLEQELGIIQSIGSAGGAIGMALGFSLPTLYFLDSKQFSLLLASPIDFSILIGALCISAGGLGIWFAKILRKKIINDNSFPFPVSNLIYNAITSQTQDKESKLMIFGLSITAIFCFLRDGILWISGLLPRVFYLLPSIFGRELAIPLFLAPSYLAIGFSSGMMVALPLLLGLLSRYLIIYPINFHANYLPWHLFQPINSQEFTLAFCSGLVFAELAYGLRSYPNILLLKLRNLMSTSFLKNDSIKSKNQPGMLNLSILAEGGRKTLPFLFDLELIFVILSSVAFLSYFKFSLISQAFMIGTLLMATYQTCVLSAKSGLLPFGRFSTFIMIPMMLMFKVDYLQITLLCTFVSICVCVASDLLFDYKVGELCKIKESTIHRYQWIGLIISSLFIGAILWLFFTNFQLGSPELCAQRGLSRALLIQINSFNYTVLLIGFVFGLFIMRFKVSSALMMGGILMPNSVSIGLIFGGMLTKLFKNPKKWIPFWSGAFAFECGWILICLIFKLFF